MTKVGIFRPGCSIVAVRRRKPRSGLALRAWSIKACHSLYLFLQGIRSQFAMISLSESPSPAYFLYLLELISPLAFLYMFKPANSLDHVCENSSIAIPSCLCFPSCKFSEDLSQTVLDRGAAARDWRFFNQKFLALIYFFKPSSVKPSEPVMARHRGGRANTVLTFRIEIGEVLSTTCTLLFSWLSTSVLSGDDALVQGFGSYVVSELLSSN